MTKPETISKIEIKWRSEKFLDDYLKRITPIESTIVFRRFSRELVNAEKDRLLKAVTCILSFND